MKKTELLLTLFLVAISVSISMAQRNSVQKASEVHVGKTAREIIAYVSDIDVSDKCYPSGVGSGISYKDTVDNISVACTFSWSGDLDDPCHWQQIDFNTDSEKVAIDYLSKNEFTKLGNDYFLKTDQGTVRARITHEKINPDKSGWTSIELTIAK